MRTPPAGFVSSLKALDPLYEVRWGGAVGKWIVERASLYSQPEMELLKNRLRRLQAAQGKERRRLPEAAEEWTAAQAARRIICYVDQLDAKVFDAVCHADIRRYGGWSRYADHLDEQDRLAEELAERRAAAVRDDLHRESWEKIEFLERNRGAQLEAGERDLQFLLDGYRTKTPARQKNVPGPLVIIPG